MVEVGPSGGFVIGLGRQFCTKRGRRQRVRENWGIRWIEWVYNKVRKKSVICKWTVTMDTYTITLARLYIYISLQPLMWVPFGPKDVYMFTFSILDLLMWVL